MAWSIVSSWPFAYASASSGSPSSSSGIEPLRCPIDVGQTHPLHVPDLGGGTRDRHGPPSVTLTPLHDGQAVEHERVAGHVIGLAEDGQCLFV